METIRLGWPMIGMIWFTPGFIVSTGLSLTCPITPLLPIGQVPLFHHTAGDNRNILRGISHHPCCEQGKHTKSGYLALSFIGSPFLFFFLRLSCSSTALVRGTHIGFHVIDRRA